MTRNPKHLAVAAAAVTALSLGACAGKSSNAGETGGTKNLKVAVWSNWDFVKRAAQDYSKAHPDVKIQVDAITGDDYFPSLPRTLPAGGPDITVLQAAATGSYPALVKEGALVDVSDIWKSQNLDSVSPPAVVKSYTEKDGKRYSVNIDETILPVVFYNKDLFASLGLQVPDGGRIQSMADFMKISETLKAANKTPMTYAWKGDGHHLFQQMLLSSCGKDKYLALAASSNIGAQKTADWTDPCVVKAIQTEKDLATQGVFGKDPIIDRDVASAAFNSQQAGMMLSGIWGVADETQKAKFKWGWFLMPPVDGGSPTEWIMYTADALGVNAKSAHVDVAKDFLATMMTKDFQSSLLTDGRPPSRTDVSTPPKAIPELVAMQKSLTTLGNETHFIQLLAPADFQDAVVSGSQQVLQGSQSPEQLAGSLDKLAQGFRDQK